MAPQGIPLIDISPYLNSDSSAEIKAKVIDQVKSACSTYGFLQITGHGVPADTQRNMLDCCKTLFDLPQAQKDALSLKNNQARRGYERIGFYIGREIPPESAGFLRGPNQWPDLPDQAFHAPVTDYYEHMLRLTHHLLEMLVLALGYETENLTTLTAEPVMNLKLLHYPPHSSKDTRQFGAGAHTDFGTLTVLLQQPGKHGLEVYHAADDEWLSVPAVEDVFVVNMGDLIQKWTGGEYSSTRHRVINAADGDRYSVPCFYQGDLRATNPFKPGEVDGETVEMHIRRKFDQSYGLNGK
ncbi:uncharacterized protein LTR77_002599 [Saxophila tyrrhenica]|uniref:Fe2OG dioxygenase domain-containing protein n=1 Tax=Saxophila tyrrhenica TaxID=1690608 RepID=A0AAV9PNV3_9PEZI|nr:hypothetical protein LTR77_002599 [Saxophila tyrrhenica]